MQIQFLVRIYIFPNRVRDLKAASWHHLANWLTLSSSICVLLLVFFDRNVRSVYCSSNSSRSLMVNIHCGCVAGCSRRAPPITLPATLEDPAVSWKGPPPDSQNFGPNTGGQNFSGPPSGYQGPSPFQGPPTGASSPAGNSNFSGPTAGSTTPQYTASPAPSGSSTPGPGPNPPQGFPPPSNSTGPPFNGPGPFGSPSGGQFVNRPNSSGPQFVGPPNSGNPHFNSPGQPFPGHQFGLPPGSPFHGGMGPGHGMMGPGPDRIDQG